MQDMSANMHSDTQILVAARILTYMYTGAARSGTVFKDPPHNSFSPEPGTVLAYSRHSESFVKIHIHASGHIHDRCAHVNTHICAQAVTCTFTAF